MGLSGRAISIRHAALLSVTAVSARTLRSANRSANQIPPKSTHVPLAGQPDSSQPATEPRRAPPAATTTAATSTSTPTGAPISARRRRIHPKTAFALS
jgi:hypothetical protein